MNQEQEMRHRRNIVSQMYDNTRWHERVAHMPTEQITAIFLKYVANPNKPRPVSFEALEEAELKSPDTYSELRLF